MATSVESRFEGGLPAGVRRASFGVCGMQDYATTGVGAAAFRRHSGVADRAHEARNRLSSQFDMTPVGLLPVKRLSEELAAVLRKRDSWSASVSPFVGSNAKDFEAAKGQLERSLSDSLPSCSPHCDDQTTTSRSPSRPVSFISKNVLEAEALQPIQKQYQHQHHQPWYSLLSCTLLDFLGGRGGVAMSEPEGGEEYRNKAKRVISSHRLSLDHRLSIERRTSCSSMASIRSSRSVSMDGGSQREMRFSRDGAMYRRALAAARRHAHEFARQDEYARDTSFYSQMAGPDQIVATRISGLSVDAGRTISGDLETMEAEEEELDKATFKRRRAAIEEAWRRSASKDYSKDLPPIAPREAHKGMPRIESTDFANDELLRRNEIFCGRC